MGSSKLCIPLLLAAVFLNISCMSDEAQRGLPQSQGPAGGSVVVPSRIVLPPRTREKVDASMKVITSALSVVKDVISQISKSKLADKLKGLATVASLAPGIGGLVASVVTVALAFIPQTDPVLTTVVIEFDRVNSKLDSISRQLADMRHDVEWNNYASMYSQDETKIVTAWNQFHNFRTNAFSSHTEEGKSEEAAKFVTFYESSHTVGSVGNLYYHLTVQEPSLNRNIVTLLVQHFKCDINEIVLYFTHFNTLLWKGMVLNQLYYKLRGFHADAMVAQYADQLKVLSEAQQKVVLDCAGKYDFLEPAVQKLNREMPRDQPVQVNQQSVDNIKAKLDFKYSWYNWIVIVFHSANRDSHTFKNFELIRLDQVSVAVSHSNFRQDSDQLQFIKRNTQQCLAAQWCDNLVDSMSCIADSGSTTGHGDPSLPLSTFYGALHYSTNSDFFYSPSPFVDGTCTIRIYSYPFMFYAKLPHNSRAHWDPCLDSDCENGATCIWVSDTVERLCQCKDGYIGDRCEENIPEVNIGAHIPQVIPSIFTVDRRLANVETHLTKISEEVAKCRQ